MAEIYELEVDMASIDFYFFFKVEKNMTLRDFLVKIWKGILLLRRNTYQNLDETSLLKVYTEYWRVFQTIKLSFFYRWGKHTDYVSIYLKWNEQLSLKNTFIKTMKFYYSIHFITTYSSKFLIDWFSQIKYRLWSGTLTIWQHYKYWSEEKWNL